MTDAAQGAGVLSVDAANMPSALLRAEMLMQAGDAMGAAELAGLAAAAMPASFAAARAHSGFLDASGRRPAAISEGRRALSLSPDNGEALLHLGCLLLAERQWQEAGECLARHVCLPTVAAGPGAWRLLSSALLGIGSTGKGLEAIDRAILLDPGQVEYRLHRASVLGLRGRCEDAIVELAAAREMAVDNARIPRASSGMREALGDLAGAYEDASMACRLSPGDAELEAHRDQVALGLKGSVDPLASAVAAREAMAWMGRSRHTRATRPPRRKKGMGALLADRMQVIHALMLREMRTRFSRSRAGYAWAVAEPLSHLLTLGSVFAFLNTSPPPVGDNLFLYYLTGLLPFLLFSHVTSEVMGSISSAGQVLQLPAVRRTDIMSARALLQLATETVVLVLAFSASAILGGQGNPDNPLDAILAILALWCLAVGVGATNMVISEFMPSWDTFFFALLRLLYFCSGIYYSPMAMPTTVRDILGWNPILQGIEAFRAAFYAGYEPHWLDRPYLFIWSLGALIFGLALERATRHVMRVNP